MQFDNFSIEKLPRWNYWNYIFATLCSYPTKMNCHNAFLESKFCSEYFKKSFEGNLWKFSKIWMHHRVFLLKKFAIIDATIPWYDCNDNKYSLLAALVWFPISLVLISYFGKYESKNLLLLSNSASKRLRKIGIIWMGNWLEALIK